MVLSFEFVALQLFQDLNTYMFQLSRLRHSLDFMGTRQQETYQHTNNIPNWKEHERTQLKNPNTKDLIDKDEHNLSICWHFSHCSKNFIHFFMNYVLLPGNLDSDVFFFFVFFFCRSLSGEKNWHLDLEGSSYCSR